MKQRIRRYFPLIILPVIAAGSVAVAAAETEAAANSPHRQIRTLVSTTYDQPGHKVETSPIVVANGYAIADWIQGDKGGRALLRRANGRWEIMACGGDGLKDVKTLGDAGIPRETATKLVLQLGRAEQSVTPDRVKRFGLFGTPGDPRAHGHPSHPRH
jgi:hypothetical protein